MTPTASRSAGGASIASHTHNGPESVTGIEGEGEAISGPSASPSG